MGIGWVYMGSVGDKLFKLRLARNLTQEQLGDVIGVTRQTISLWEASKRQINAERLQSISEYFGVEPEYFFANENADIESDDEKRELAIVACAEYEKADEPQSKCDLLPINIKSEVKPARKSAKKIILISILVAVVIIGIIALLVGYCFAGHKDSFGTSSSVTYNFGAESIGWIVFVLAGIMALVCVAILVKTKLKEKRSNK